MDLERLGEGREMAEESFPLAVLAGNFFWYIKFPSSVVAPRTGSDIYYLLFI